MSGDTYASGGPVDPPPLPGWFNYDALMHDRCGRKLSEHPIPQAPAVRCPFPELPPREFARTPAPRPAGQGTGHQQTAAEVDYWETAMAELDSCGLMPSDAGTIGTIAAALAATDRDGYQRGREEMARKVRALAEHYEAPDPELLEPAAWLLRRVACDLRALAGRNDEKEGQ